MKKLLVLLLAAAIAVFVYRRLSASPTPAASRPHQHGTPDHWPPVVRRPGSEPASAA
jgi:hypothetical protein